MLIRTAIQEISKNQEGFFRGVVGSVMDAHILLGGGDRRGRKGIQEAHHQRWVSVKAECYASWLRRAREP